MLCGAITKVRLATRQVQMGHKFEVVCQKLGEMKIGSKIDDSQELFRAMFLPGDGRLDGGEVAMAW